MSNFPESLLNFESLSKEIWESFKEHMRTDSAPGEDEIPNWEELEDLVRIDFEEAIQRTVCSPLNKYKKAVEQMSGVNSSSPCYICQKAAVYSAGCICSLCYHIYIESARVHDGRKF